MCNPFTSLLCNTNIGEWIFQGLLGWSIGFTTLFCFGPLWVVALLVMAWGRVMGYTKPIQNPQTEADYLQNRRANQEGTLFWMMKTGTVFVIIMSLIAYLIGQLFGR